MSDLQTRRAIIQGMDSDGHYKKVKVKVPLAEMYKYNASLRALSQGRAKYSRAFGEYSPLSRELQKELISSSQLEEAMA